MENRSKAVIRHEVAPSETNDLDAELLGLEEDLESVKGRDGGRGLLEELAVLKSQTYFRF